MLFLTEFQKGNIMKKSKVIKKIELLTNKLFDSNITAAKFEKINYKIEYYLTKLEYWGLK